MACFIWLDKEERNSYAEFFTEFTLPVMGEVTVEISVHTNYALSINGQVVGFGQYADYPFYKVYDSINITEAVKTGKNTLAVICYYLGEDTATNYDMAPGLWFKVISGKNTVSESGTMVLGRKSREYIGLDELITPQLGRNYLHDLTMRDGYEKAKLAAIGEFGFTPTKICDCEYALVPRPIKKLVLQEAENAEIIRHGLFCYNSGETAAQLMNRARLYSISEGNAVYSGALVTILSGQGDGSYFLADLKRECAGYISFEITVDKDCDMLLGFGEHITDDRVRTEIEGRNFAYRYRLKKGANRVDEYLKRTGARYLSVMIESRSCTVATVTMREAAYPVTQLPFKGTERIMTSIYDTAVRTLRLCMHEHYEDCPWREQALYALDGRNQMLFGYYVFEDSNFAKASLRLLGLGLCEDGLLSLCARFRCSVTIPSFSLYWVLSMCEYYEHVADKVFFDEMLPAVKTVLGVFLQSITVNGLKTLGDTRYWNFHEWSEGLDGGSIFREERIEEKYDANLTALASITFKKTYDITGIKEYDNASQALKAATKSFLTADGLYCSYINSSGKAEGKHMFTQAMMLFSQCAENSVAFAEKMVKQSELTPLTIVALPFFYDGLLSVSAKYLKFVLKDIERIYVPMLNAGATSFYETEKGEADFNGAGSLCHGWASVPAYIYAKYLKH